MYQAIWTRDNSEKKFTTYQNQDIEKIFIEIIGHHLQYGSSIKPTLDQHLEFAGYELIMWRTSLLLDGITDVFVNMPGCSFCGASNSLLCSKFTNFTNSSCIANKTDDWMNELHLLAQISETTLSSDKFSTK